VGVSAETLAFVAMSFGAGYVMGVALKKAAGFILTVTGLYMLSLMALANLGVVSVNWAALLELARRLTGSALSPLAALGVLSLPMAAGMVMGMLFSRCAVQRTSSTCYWVRG